MAVIVVPLVVGIWFVRLLPEYHDGCFHVVG